MLNNNILRTAASFLVLTLVPACYLQNKNLEQHLNSTQTTSTSKISYQNKRQDQLLSDFLYFKTEEDITSLERTGDPEFSSKYSLLKNKEKIKPRIMTKKDFDYYMTQQKIREIEKKGDPFILFDREYSIYLSLTKRLETFRGYKLSISEEEWARVYSDYEQREKEKTHDPEIFIR